jgi:hypothetical protein
MSTLSELAVTLSPELYAHLTAESQALDVPLEWLVASLAFDTFGDHLLTGAPAHAPRRRPQPNCATTSSERLLPDRRQSRRLHGPAAACPRPRAMA